MNEHEIGLLRFYSMVGAERGRQLLDQWDGFASGTPATKGKRLTLTMPTEKELQAGKDRLVDMFPQLAESNQHRGRKAEPNSLRQRVLSHVKEHAGISTHELATLFGVVPSKMAQTLHSLKQTGNVSQPSMAHWEAVQSA